MHQVCLEVPPRWRSGGFTWRCHFAATPLCMHTPFCTSTRSRISVALQASRLDQYPIKGGSQCVQSLVRQWRSNAQLRQDVQPSGMYDMDRS